MVNFFIVDVWRTLESFAQLPLELTKLTEFSLNAFTEFAEFSDKKN